MVKNVQKMQIFHIFSWENPMGALKIKFHPMGKWMAFFMSACLPDSNVVEILKIWQVLNSLPYLHMGLRDLSFTPFYTIDKLWYTFMSKIWLKSFVFRITFQFHKYWSKYSNKMPKKASKEWKKFDRSTGIKNGRF